MTDHDDRFDECLGMPLADTPEANRPAITEWVFLPDDDDVRKGDQSREWWFLEVMYEFAIGHARHVLGRFARDVHHIDENDIAQDVMVRLTARLPSKRMQRPGAWRGYVAVAVRNRVNEKLREMSTAGRDWGQRADSGDEATSLPSTTAADQQHWLAMRAWWLTEAIPRLPADQRAVVLERFSLPYDVTELDTHRSRNEIATRLGLNPARVQRLLDAARPILKQAFEEWGQ